MSSRGLEKIKQALNEIGEIKIGPPAKTIENFNVSIIDKGHQILVEAHGKIDGDTYGLGYKLDTPIDYKEMAKYMTMLYNGWINTLRHKDYEGTELLDNSWKSKERNTDK